MTTAVDTRGRPPSRPKLKDTWWRHVVGDRGATIISLFPIAYMISSAFNREQTLGRAQRSSRTHVTGYNFGNLLHNNAR